MGVVYSFCDGGKKVSRAYEDMVEIGGFVEQDITSLGDKDSVVVDLRSKHGGGRIWMTQKGLGNSVMTFMDFTGNDTDTNNFMRLMSLVGKRNNIQMRIGRSI